MLLISSALMIVIGIAAILFQLVIAFDFPISMAQTTTTTAESFWTDGAPMPTPRTEVTAAVLEDDIYVIGGFDEFGQVTGIVEVYNIANNTWSKAAAPLPVPLHHTAAASYNGKIYVVGGYTAPWSPSNKLFIYDPVQNSWQEGKSMPTARGALNVNFVNGIIYAIGGRISGSLENISVNEAYDPEQDTWITNLEAMPSKRSGIAAAAAADAAAATADNASSINASNIYVFGGEEPFRTFNNNEKYDATTNKWTSEPPMPTARHGLVAVYMKDDKIYVIGGGPQPGLSVSGANEIFHVR